MTVFHALEGVGTLAVDNYSLVSTTQHGPGANSFDKGYVTLSFDDGWSSAFDNALPILQNGNIHGTFYIISQYMLHSNVNLFTDPSAASNITIVTNAQGTAWNTLFTDPVQHTFVFSDTYTSSGPSVLEVTYIPQSTNTATTTIEATFPAGTGATAASTFTLPILAGPISVSHHAVVSTDTLTQTNATLLQPTGYMGTEQVRALLNAGNEIGDHTQDHADLNALTQAQQSQEILGGKTDLSGALNTTIDTFAYPFGNETPTALNILKSNGFLGARSTITGYNDKTTDKFNLVEQEIDDTTTLTQIKSWIDTAVANKTWLILMFHQVDHSALPFSTTPETLQGVTGYLPTSGAQVITVHQGLQLMP
jgi:peptidoglycan/xylan/chitin deacetylase (PgdA/CDA1 family)